MKIILLNGAPGAGKDTFGKFMQEKLEEVSGAFEPFTEKFARAVKERCHASFLLIDYEGQPYPHDYYEAVKDKPHEDFLGVSPRAAYTAFSERYYKVLFGTEVFGKITLERLLKLEKAWAGHSKELVVFMTDSGFAVEARPLIRCFGASNVCKMTIMAEARGKTFVGDSRVDWSAKAEGIRGFHVVNGVEGDETWLHVGTMIILDWLMGRERP